MDNEEYDTVIDDRDCIISLIKSVFTMILNGKDHSYIANVIPITKETVDIFSSVTSINNVDLVKFLPDRGAFKIKVNSAKVLQIVRSVNNIYDSQANALLASDNVKYKEYFTSMMPLYKQYLIYLNASVKKSLLSENSRLIKGVSNELITEFMELKASYIPVLEKMFFKYDVIKITVDEQTLSTSLLSYKAKVEGRKLYFSLIKAGANFSFITENITAYISLPQFKRLREVFNVSKNAEYIDAQKGAAIYGSFMSMIENKHSIIDIYISLHRTYKLRIDTLTLCINSVLEGVDKGELMEGNKEKY